MDWFNLSECNLFSGITPQSQSLAPFDNRSQNTSFFHGAFRKYSSTLGGYNYILKVIQEEHPELQAAEFLCNQIYEHLNIHISDYYLIRYPTNEHYCFVTRNFMSKRIQRLFIFITI